MLKPACLPPTVITNILPHSVENMKKTFDLQLHDFMLCIVTPQLTHGCSLLKYVSPTQYPQCINV